MRRYALVGVLVAALSCARQATAWDYTCWDCVAFRASLWLPFSEGDIQSRQWAVAAKMAADQFNARNGSIVAEFAELPPECSTFKLSVDVWDTAGGPTEAINCWEIHSCGLLKKEASIVCHGASGEKLCCASKQEHCCIYDEGSIKPLFISTLVVVIILGLFLILQCWRWSRPEPAPLRASSAAPPPEREPVAQAEIVPYPNR